MMEVRLAKLSNPALDNNAKGDTGGTINQVGLHNATLLSNALCHPPILYMITVVIDKPFCTMFYFAVSTGEGHMAEEKTKRLTNEKVILEQTISGLECKKDEEVV